MTRSRCLLVVERLKCNSLAMRRLVLSSATRSRTSSSRGVSDVVVGPLTVALGGVGLYPSSDPSVASRRINFMASPCSKGVSPSNTARTASSTLRGSEPFRT